MSTPLPCAYRTNRIWKVLSERSMTLTTVATRTGIDLSQLSRIANARRTDRASRERAERIATALGMGVDDVFSEPVYPPAPKPLGPGAREAAPLDERVRQYVTVEEPDACWLWRGPICGQGPYRVPALGVHKHRTYSARRIAWSMAHGSYPPAERNVYVTCGNALCMNPAHFTLDYQWLRDQEAAA